MTIEQKARRDAKRAGLIATKSRRRKGTIDNHGRFMLLDPDRNWIVAGEKFDLTPEQIIEFCGQEAVAAVRA